MPMNFDFTTSKDKAKLKEYEAKYRDLFFVMSIIIGFQLKTTVLKDTKTNKIKFIYNLVETWPKNMTFVEAEEIYNAAIGGKVWRSF